MSRPLALRPGWWPWWVPGQCENEHLLRPGTVTLSWVRCDCIASEPAEHGGSTGHHNWYCAADGCGEEYRPYGCDRDLDQR